MIKTLNTSYVSFEMGQAFRGASNMYYGLQAAMETAPEVKPEINVDALSNFIREIDGNNTMGAGALAEKIAEYLGKPASSNVVERIRALKNAV